MQLKLSMTVFLLLHGKDLALSLNDYFSNINADLPCLDLCSLPAYLPAPHPVPTISVEETCYKMLSIGNF